QAYVEIDCNQLKVKVGHFYSPLDYESAMAKDNFFVTHSYAFQYGEPTTQTGVLATKPINSWLSWTAGGVSGWREFNDERAQVVGGLTYNDRDCENLSIMVVTGDDSTIFLPGIGPYANRTMYSVVSQTLLTERCTYVLQHDLGVQQDAATLQGTARAEWYGV